MTLQHRMSITTSSSHRKMITETRAPADDDWSCILITNAPKIERKPQFKTAPSLCHECSTSKRQKIRDQFASLRMSLDLGSSADSSPTYIGVGDNINQEDTCEGEDGSEHHGNAFSPEMRSAPTESGGMGKERGLTEISAMLRSCPGFFPLHKSQPPGEISSRCVDGVLRDNNTVLPERDQRRSAWRNGHAFSHRSSASIEFGHDEEKVDMRIGLSRAAEAIRSQEVAREPSQVSEPVCKHASTSRVLRTMDWCSILLGGLASVAIINFHSSSSPGMCSQPETDPRRLMELPWNGHLSQSLRCPSFPQYLAAIWAYSAMGLYHLVRRPPHWVDCGLLAVIGSILTGAWFGKRAMVDALIMGGFLSLVCSKAIEAIIDRRSTATTADAEGKSTPPQGQPTPTIVHHQDGAWRY
ncbi:hypothetical protein BR93DRAFT_924366 [Coniochaeta sp. PMI_546]|nr:hypothetical protein BR93DRAFT_924366 [Coniochaeta sp. PMI_546]